MLRMAKWSRIGGCAALWPTQLAKRFAGRLVPTEPVWTPVSEALDELTCEGGVVSAEVWSRSQVLLVVELWVQMKE